ncbi:DUF1850 domain-containing protein [Solibacillus sp. FSL H8-0538]|uniref:DUF1850 domain-containing protein n=1 Tax=Solibacillus sp. FSL H8-0538 TaxID=2921400 RepID=UPI0030F839C6
MKKWVVMVIICGLIALMFIPFGRALTFTETRTDQPTLHYIKLTEHTDFQIIFTHSIHLTDVIESYHVRPTNDFQLLSMEYSDVAIGMPAYAEDGQTLIYEDGVYTLSYDEAILQNFTLYIGDVDYKLQLQYMTNIIDLKEQLTRGKSYLFEVKKLSFYEKLKGVELYGG